MLEETVSTLMRLIFVLCASSYCWSAEVSQVQYVTVETVTEKSVTVESVTLDAKSLIDSKDSLTPGSRKEEEITTSVILNERNVEDDVETESHETDFAESSPYISSTDTIVGDFNVSGLPWLNNNTETLQSEGNESELDVSLTNSKYTSSDNGVLNLIRPGTNHTEATHELNISISDQHSIASMDASSNVKQSASLQQSGFKETHEANVPYQVSSDSGKVHNLRLNHKHNKFEIKHHLQLGKFFFRMTFTTDQVKQNASTILLLG